MKHFCENQEQETYISRWLDWVWLEKCTSFFYSLPYTVFRSRTASGVLESLLLIVSMNNEENEQYETFLWNARKRNLYITLTWLSLTWKMYTVFYFLPHPLLRSRTVSGVLEGLLLMVSRGKWTLRNIFVKAIIRILYFTLTWLSLTWKCTPFLISSHTRCCGPKLPLEH